MIRRWRCGWVVLIVTGVGGCTAEPGSGDLAASIQTFLQDFAREALAAFLL